MQKAKFIDITRSFIPVDPDAYPNNYHGTTSEDAPEDAAKVVPYEGHNFLPTAYGYKSYFGIANKVGIDALTSRVDAIFLVQSLDLAVRFVALCEDGIWLKDATEVGAWTHSVVLEFDPLVHKDWTYCVLNNDLYCYQQGATSYYKLASAPSISLIDTFTTDVGTITPEYAAMTGGVPAGTYAWAIAARNSAGLVGAPSAWSANTAFAAAGSATLTFTADANAAAGSAYRIYRKDVATGIISCWDIVPYVRGASLVVYDANQPAEVVTLPDASWLEASAVQWGNPQAITPDFLNMEGQLGIFAAGIRLGFWDSTNSISWSSIDDYADFTPSIETLAGSAIFSSVQGKIVNILPHGDGFVIYATKNIVLVSRRVEATFQWQPDEIVNSGIAFAQEAVAGIPNTVHYARTSSAIYKIEEGSAEVVLPEFNDYLKPLDTPVYLQLLEDRYLCFQIMDSDFMAGQVQFTVDTIPASTFTMTQDTVAGFSLDDIELSGNSACYAFAGQDAGASTQAEAESNRASQSKPPKAPNTFYTPIYDAYFSHGHAGDGDAITWTNTPCVGTFQMSPSTDTGKLSRATQDATSKLYMPNTTFDTISFYQTQLAIWAMEDAKRESFLSAILSRYQESRTVTATTLWADPRIVTVPMEGVNDPANVSPYTTGAKTATPCTIGDYIADVSEPMWGINSCSFWVYRYITKIVHVTAWETLQEVAVNTIPAPGGMDGWFNQECRGADTALYAWPFSDPVSILQREYEILQSRGSSEQISAYKFVPDTWYKGNTWWNRYMGGGEWSWLPHQYASKFASAKFEQTTFRTAYNKGAYEVGIFGVDVGWLQLVGWSYTDENNQAQTVAKVVGCVRPDLTKTEEDPPVPSTPGTKDIPTDSNDGTMCGVPFTPVVLEGISSEPIVWPTQSVTLPPAVFLLQEGSPTPVYPTFHGAFVYDTHLKKWGKLKQTYKHLLDYLPLNHAHGDLLPIAGESMISGLLDEGGTIRLFDDVPLSSYITYGKIGYYRRGFTNAEEVIAHFKKPATGVLEVQGSLDGVSPEARILKTVTMDGEMSGRILANLSARWYNVTIRGHYDLAYLEFRGVSSTRR